MSRRLALLGALLLAASLAAASGLFPPQEAARVSTGESEVAHWIGEADTVADSIPPTGFATLRFAVKKTPPANASAESEPAPEPNPEPAPEGEQEPTPEGESPPSPDGEPEPGAQPPTGNETAPSRPNPGDAYQRAYINVTSSDLIVDHAELVLVSTYMTSNVWDFTETTFTLADPVGTTAAYRFSVEIYHDDGNVTTLVASMGGEGSIAIGTPVAPIPPGLFGFPTPVVLGALGLLVVAVGAGAFTIQKRRERARMRAPPRSQALREEKLERAVKRGNTEDVHRVQQEIRHEEKRRERRRELQILDAKRADALKSMDMLQKRRDAGALSQHQFDQMIAKKRDELARLESEIAAMESADAAGAAA